ncbi:DUF4919 domain-containing protein [Ulvibacter litoralis]|uniref:DUF4919 domain-containing protein n=1 Tax=Ulvibacter litoralis TaxID=227084 RepID=A0A1G7CPV8_9FLAO|nr:DUF4919 domain-containing protein [Ulvibacter litoralis]GHC46559.1 DUF4919 domain-containing protein [Ulvibacter litoralis]SDE41382.1 protein of unknown function [Ulvibacter litoralis]
MKHLLLVSFLVVSFLGYAQNWEFEKPDYSVIKKNIENKNSGLFYETLMGRFVEADTTLTLEEKRHLYYGYSFNENYSPYSRSKLNDTLRVIMQKETLSPDDLTNVLQFSETILKTNPFDLRSYNRQLYVYEQLRDRENYDKTIRRRDMIVDALISSGDGTSKEDSFYVIYTAHEYDLIQIVGLDFGGMQQLIEHYDYLTVAENDAGLEGLYFDVSPCLNSMSAKLKK